MLLLRSILGCETPFDNEIHFGYFFQYTEVNLLRRLGGFRKFGKDHNLSYYLLFQKLRSL